MFNSIRLQILLPQIRLHDVFLEAGLLSNVPRHLHLQYRLRQDGHHLRWQDHARLDLLPQQPRAPSRQPWDVLSQTMTKILGFLKNIYVGQIVSSL